MGTITASGPTEVKYTWVSSDGGTWPEGVVRFSAAGARVVREEREGGEAGKHFSGWMVLKVLAPNHLESTKAVFDIFCGGAAGRPAASATGEARPGANAGEVEAAVREAETQMRETVDKYRERVAQMHFPSPMGAPERKSLNDSILNAYNGSMKAIERIRNESDAKISRMHPPAEVKNNSVRTLQRAFQSNAHELQLLERGAMDKLHAAEGRRPAKK